MYENKQNKEKVMREDIVPDWSSEVAVDIIIDEENGIVLVRAGMPHIPDSWTNGYSFTHPDDKFDLDIGIELAGGRAIQELGNKLVRRANKEVNRRDKFRRSQKKASEAAIALRKEKSAQVKAELAGQTSGFQIGDTVKIVKNNYSEYGEPFVGKTAKVVGYLDDRIRAVCDDNLIFCDPDEIEKVSVAQVRKDLPA
jgi:ribosomal protein L21E